MIIRTQLFGKSYLNKLAKRLLEGNTGFYEMKKGQTSLRLMAGFRIMIPFRNQYNQIVGWQVRVDEVKNSVHVKSGPTGIQAELVQQPNVVKITKTRIVSMKEN